MTSKFDVKWLDNHDAPDPSWNLSETRDAAFEAACEAGWDADGDARRDAIMDKIQSRVTPDEWATVRQAAIDAVMTNGWDSPRHLMALEAEIARAAALAYADYRVVVDLFSSVTIALEHRDYIERRWRVWERGYGLYTVVGDTFIVYKRAA